ncbi:hypothetical protein J6S88_02495 [bacterium]|nr:hypothetical protein [bacterium]
MSVSVSALPFMLIYSLAASAVSAVNNSIVAGLKSGNGNLHLENAEIAQKFFNKDFETTIMDEAVLIKTLNEHGATALIKEEGTIECNCEYFHLVFTRKSADAPYTMKITANENKGVDEIAKDIGTEYTLNAQEISYNKIKERLEAQNLQITDEEIFDDNTIVLTVNLED